MIDFEALLPPISRQRLTGDSGRLIGTVRSILVAPRAIFVADGSQGDVKVFDRATGRFLRAIGRGGDGPGEFRLPAGLEFVGGGRLAVLDLQRKVLSFRDVDGGRVREMPLLGLANALTSLRGGLLLVGRIHASVADSVPYDASVPILHEIDTSGVLGRSFLTVDWPKHPWTATFANHFATTVGDVAVVGSYHLSTVSFVDLASGRTWSAAIGAPWYHAPDWPQDSRALSGSSSSQEIMTWLDHQTLIHRVVGLADSTFLAMARLPSDSGGSGFGYVVAGIDGVTKASTTRTNVELMRAIGDTVWGVSVSDSGEVTLETRLLNRTLVRSDQ